ncbi:MAG: DUF1134 domain-containing protein [Phenylobacterium sp.]
MNMLRKRWRSATGFSLALALGLMSAQAAIGQSEPASPPPAANGDIQAPHPAEGAPPAQTESQTYSADEVTQAASKFFGSSSEGLAKAIERTFSDYGRPNAYIYGNEGGGAIVVGLRYGKGTLQYKGGESQKVYWQGPSVGWDFGGNASRVFTLCYNLDDPRLIFQRYPGVEGSAYFIGGLGVNYQQTENIVLAPIRAGVGFRLGANVGYLAYSRTRNLFPF